MKKCLYCENMTDDPHFESGCCGRGMCNECYGSLQGTDEQFQIAYMSDEDYGKYIEGTSLMDKGDYVCFECVGKNKCRDGKHYCKPDDDSACYIKK